MYPIDIIVIIREYYKIFCGNKYNNLDLMDRFFERHKLPKLTQLLLLQSASMAVTMKPFLTVTDNYPAIEHNEPFSTDFSV